MNTSHQEERRERLKVPLELERAEYLELSRPWLVEWPWFRFWTVPSSAREEIRMNQRELGERFWDELWDGRDQQQGAVRVRSTGEWHWRAAKLVALQEAAAQAEKPARMKVLVGGQIK